MKSIPNIVFDRYLSPHLYDFLEALITQQTSPDEAYRKFDAIASKHTEQLRKYTKQVQEARNQHDDEAVKRAINEYEDALGKINFHEIKTITKFKIYFTKKNIAAIIVFRLFLGRYIPVLMAQAKIYWDLEMYQQVILNSEYFF